MKVILFASAMLAAIGDAIPLESSNNSALNLAQVSQMLPNQQQQFNPKEIVKKAEKAMDKDDKKKMGNEKFHLYEKIRKTLQGKNRAAREMA